MRKLKESRGNKPSVERDATYIKNRKYGFTKRQVVFFVSTLVDRLNKAIMEPGEPVGAITAQSIG